MSLVLKCKKHPTYMAYREPKADCPGCRLLWKVKVDARESGVETAGTLAVLSILRG